MAPPRPTTATVSAADPASAPANAPARVTPMMRQYLEIKEAYPDCILFFRLGDFYEMFFDDALTASEILEITLTSRDKGENAVPMCGVPHHSAKGYIAKLVGQGHKVAVCEQVEEPGKGKLVRRAVTQVVTPGLVTDDDMLEAKRPHYLLAVVEARGKDNGFYGFAYLDVTTGEFRVGVASSEREMAGEAARIEPRELLLPEVVAGPEDLKDSAEQTPSWAPPGAVISRVEPGWARPREARRLLQQHFDVVDLGGFELGERDEALGAAGTALAYVGAHHRAGLPNVRAIRRHLSDRVMFLGETTKRNLELFQTLAGATRAGTLLALMDRTRTAMGGRALRRWLAYPLMEVVKIQARLGAVAEFVARGDTRKKLREALRTVSDVERLTGRVSMGSANGRDLVLLRDSLAALPLVQKLLDGAQAELLGQISAGIDPVPEVEQLLAAALADDPPAILTEGGLIREGYDPEIDELRSIQSGGRGWIAQLQASERERTGIGSLKVGFNKVFGYYIEVSRAKQELVPEEYERRQTLSNAERYITPELKEMESKVLGAEEKAHELEYRRFVGVRERVSAHVDRLTLTAHALAALDVLAGLAELAVERRYVRPHVDDGYELQITGGRHPVVEAMLTDERFVPNDVTFDRDENRLLIITGPNMSGKSTILRQTALIALMAQMGSFVPAEQARIGLVDRVFTRVGAADDLARGRSTFMVEMMESAAILHNATEKSLVILDEIGRGTSTFDGLSIAWAVAEYIHGKGARTLFATHYHELTDLARTLRGVANFNVAVKQWQGRIVFLRRLVEGGVSRSYGIQVAQLAGLPEQVIARAKEVLENLESGELDETGLPKLAASQLVAPEMPHRQLDLFLGGGQPRRDRLLEELSKISVEELTPLEAAVQLDALRTRARELTGKGPDRKGKG